MPQIVISVNDKDYKHALYYNSFEYKGKYVSATALPEKHGSLIDKGELPKDISRKDVESAPVILKPNE